MTQPFGVHTCILLGAAETFWAEASGGAKTSSVAVVHMSTLLTQANAAHAYLHIDVCSIYELQQGLIGLLAIKAGQDSTQVQQGWVKGCFQHET